VGNGSTANFFIDELAKIKHRIKGAVASSVKTAERPGQPFSSRNSTTSGSAGLRRWR
jgi:ribose 5-phosphate isomerase